MSIKFKSLTIKNSRVYKSIRIPLDNQGIVSIIGPNGVGKSTIFSLLEAIFYGSTPTGHRRDNLVRNNKDAFLQVEFEKDGDSHTIIYSRIKGKWAHRIFKNEKDETDHTALDAAKTAKSKLGLTQKEFEGSIHLTQNAQHLLIDGEPADRKKYISDFFGGIDENFDKICSAAKEKLTNTQEAIERISNLSFSKQTLENELSTCSLSDLTKLQVELESFRKNLSVTEEDLIIVRKELEEAKTYKLLSPLANKYDNPESEIHLLELSLINHESSLKTTQLIKQHNFLAIETNKKFDKLNFDLADILAKYPQVEDSIDYEKKYIELNQIKKQSESMQLFIVEYRSIPEVEEIDVSKIKEDLRQATSNTDHLSRKLAAIDDGKCPTCGHIFKTEEILSERENLENSKKILSRLENCFKQSTENNKKYLRKKYLESVVLSIQEWTEKLEGDLLVYSNLMQKKKIYLEINKQISTMRRLDIQPEIDENSIREQIAIINGKLIELRECLDAKKKLPKKPRRDIDGIIQDIETLEDNINDLNQEQNILRAQLNTAKTENDRYNRLLLQIKEIDAKLEKLEALKKEEYFWIKMIEAYGPKGLRLKQLDKVMEMILKRLPYYTSILFQERGLSFKHTCDSGSINIYATRQIEEENKILSFEHDISSLSGGEKKRLSVALVLTLADCVPMEKRSNILVLDEIDANLDSDGQTRFVNDLLPLLRKEYESIFIISHADEINQANVFDHTWKVKKKNHWSEIDISA